MLSKVIKLDYMERKTGNPKDIYRNLEEALKLSKEVRSRLREMNNKQAELEEKAFLSEICFEIGKYYEIIETQLDFAEKAYIESINNWETNQKYKKINEKIFHNLPFKLYCIKIVAYCFLLVDKPKE